MWSKQLKMNEKEEVKKAVMELKMFGSIADLENPPENDLDESGDDIQPQVRERRRCCSL